MNPIDKTQQDRKQKDLTKNPVDFLFVCLLGNTQRWGIDKEFILLGDFNEHIQELYGYLDHNGGLVQALDDEESSSRL